MEIFEVVGQLCSISCHTVIQKWGSIWHVDKTKDIHVNILKCNI